EGAELAAVNLSVFVIHILGGLTAGLILLGGERAEEAKHDEHDSCKPGHTCSFRSKTANFPGIELRGGGRLSSEMYIVCGEKSNGGKQESGVRSQESGVSSQESGVRSQESGVSS